VDNKENIMPKAVLESKESLRKKVLQGVSWLNEQGLGDWKYRLFKEENGKRHFLGQLCMAKTSILPLAFGDSLNIKYSTDLGICAHFKMSHRFRVDHGFFVDIGWDLLIFRLTEVWEEVLREEIENDEFLTEDGSLR